MLSGNTLNHRLLESVHEFAGTQAIDTLSTLAALNKLIELFPAYPNHTVDSNGQIIPNPAVSSYAPTVTGRVELLRRRLRNILAAENQENKPLSAQAFVLMMTLAHGFPVNAETDIISQEDFNKDSQLVFLSDGTVFEKESALAYFTFNNNPYIDLNREPLSVRELASLRAQGVTCIPADAIPEPAAIRFGKKIGAFISATLTISSLLLLQLAQLFNPLLVVPMLIIGATAIFASSDHEPVVIVRVYAAMTGVALLAAAATIAFPPLLGILAAHAMLSAATVYAVAAVSPYVVALGVPALLVVAACVRKIFSPHLSFHDALYSITAIPHTLLRAVTTRMGGMIGAGINGIRNFFNPPARQGLLIPAALMAEPTPTVAAAANSNAVIQRGLNIHTALASTPARRIEVPADHDTGYAESIQLPSFLPEDLVPGMGLNFMRHA